LPSQKNHFHYDFVIHATEGKSEDCEAVMLILEALDSSINVQFRRHFLHILTNNTPVYISSGIQTNAPALLLDEAVHFIVN
jgi:hypothetical protein